MHLAPSSFRCSPGVFRSHYSVLLCIPDFIHLPFTSNSLDVPKPVQTSPSQFHGDWRLAKSSYLTTTILFSISISKKVKVKNVLRRLYVLHDVSFSNICYLQASSSFILVFHCCFQHFQCRASSWGGKKEEQFRAPYSCSLILQRQSLFFF